MDRLTSINVNKVSQNLSNVLFNKSLVSMVKGMRAARDNGGQHAELQYINKCIVEISTELQSQHNDTKSIALQKMIYLHMYGYDMSRYVFNIVEVMSCQWFGYKKIAYLSAALIFTPQTDVILLTTHTFRKAFTGSSVNTSNNNNSVYMPTTNTPLSYSDGLQYEIGSALGCFSSIVTRDLAVDLLPDIQLLLHSTRPYIRKRAILTLLNVFTVYPESLNDDNKYIDYIVKSLTDEHSGVVSAAVYVICELAHKQPDKYLYLTPIFFDILTTSSNNWVLIKVVKLLGSLVPYESRLLKKLITPLSDIISTTPAKSLLYECVNTMLSGDLTVKPAVMLCLDKLKLFITDADQNLKYLGLLGLHKLMLKYPKLVSEHKDLVLDCLSDDDITIRMRALDLITSMCNQRNLQSIVNRIIELLEASDLGHYRIHVLNRLIDICSNNNYEYIVDFEWYISTLLQLTYLQSIDRQHTSKINQQLLDVTIRVPDIRQYAVTQMTDLLLSERLSQSTNNTMCEVLYSAGFVVGEYAQYVTQHQQLIQYMVQQSNMTLPAVVQQIYMQAAFKLLVAAMQDDTTLSNTDTDVGKISDLLQIQAIDSENTEQPTDTAITEHNENKDDDNKNNTAVIPHQTKSAKVDTILELCEILIQGYTIFSRSNYPEVQERAVSYQHFVQWIQSMLHNNKTNNIINITASATDPLTSEFDSNTEHKSDTTHTDTLSALATQLHQLFAEQLNPVNIKAQKKVPVPKEIDLNQPFNTSWNDTDTETIDETSDTEPIQQHSDSDTSTKRKTVNKHKLTKSERKQLTLQSRHINEQRRKTDPFYLREQSDSPSDTDIPIQSLDTQDLPPIETNITSNNKTHKHKHRHNDIVLFDSDDDTIEQQQRKHHIVATEELPSGAELSDTENSVQQKSIQRLQLTDGKSKKRSKRKSKRTDTVPQQEQPAANQSKDVLSLDLFDPLNSNTTQPQPLTQTPEPLSTHKTSLDSADTSQHNSNTSGSSQQSLSHTMYRDSQCRINYTTQLTDGKLQLQVYTVTKSSHTLDSMEYAVELTGSRSILISSSDTVDARAYSRATITYSANVDIKQQKYFIIESLKHIKQLLKLRCTVHRVDQHNNDNNKVKSVDIKIPLYTFIYANEISMNELQAKLSAADTCTAIQKCTVIADNIDNIIEQIQLVCNVSVVNDSQISNTVMLYGEWCKPAKYTDFIAIMLKLKSDNLQISVKTTHQSAADDILAELIDTVK